MSSFPTPRRRRSGCPLCGGTVTPAHDPFCSAGCRDRDLLKWLGEGYRVPARPEEADEAEGAENHRQGLDSDADRTL